MKLMNFICYIAVIILLIGCANASSEEFYDVTENRDIITKHHLKRGGDLLKKFALDEIIVTTTEKVQYKVNEENWRIEPIDTAPENVLLLTIDDAPDKHGVEMARILTELNVMAIFFVNGHFLQGEEGKRQLEEIVALGHEIGNHTMTHPNLRKLSEDEQRKEIVELNHLLEELTGIRPRFFRAPFGVNTDVARAVVREEKMQLMNWSYGYDYFSEYMEKEALINKMVNAPELTNGANLLLHDREFTKEALPGIVNGLQEKGYVFVSPNMIK